MKITYLLLVFFLLSSCKTTDTTDSVTQKGVSFKNFRGYKPVDPVEFENQITIKDLQGSLISKDIKLLTREEILGFLSNETVLVSIGEIQEEGSINSLPVASSKKNTSYKVTMDYMKYATLPGISNEKFIDYKRVGVGLRLISLITTAEAGINISDLYSIGLAAKQNKLSGTLIIEIIGIKSREVTSLIPLPSEINQTTIQNAMQALATIKSKIYEDETSLYPQVMAVKEFKAEKNIPSGKDSSLASTTSEITDRTIQLQFGNIDFGLEEKELEASRILKDALTAALEKDVDRSILMLEEYGRKFRKHNLNGMIKVLKDNRDSLLSKDEADWKEIYAMILREHKDKLSEDIITELESS